MSGDGRLTITLNDLRWLPLDKLGVRNGLSVFRAEDKDGTFKQAYDTLDGWLSSTWAAQMHANGHILTTVAVHGDRPVGFIATHAYALHDSHEGAKSMALLRPYSALKILHLAALQYFNDNTTRAGREEGQPLAATRRSQASASCLGENRE
jgi:hypothetical protein